LTLHSLKPIILPNGILLAINLMDKDTNTNNQQIFKTISELGHFIRTRRKQVGFRNIGHAAKAFSVGKRFLSECERGKETAEIGKVLNVLQGLGLDLAVVPHESIASSSQHHKQFSATSLVSKLALDFPYDWSNSAMRNDLLIHNVLKKGRFMDILRLVKHFGIEYINIQAQEFEGTASAARTQQILDRIRTGNAKAKR